VYWAVKNTKKKNKYRQQKFLSLFFFFADAVFFFLKHHQHDRILKKRWAPFCANEARAAKIKKKKTTKAKEFFKKRCVNPILIKM
jgi:hypothetical protein